MPEATGPQAISVPAALVAAATEAIEEGRLVAPGDRNARTLFREALYLEPGNTDALQGLRVISNDFVQQAQLALSADDPLQAYAALAVALETDPANPAIEIVEQLLVAKADSELADARLAVATGNLDLAAERLARAEQYTSTDMAEVQAIRQQIARSQQDEQLTTGLLVADGYMAEGRLLNPEEENAHALLLDLYARYGDDARLRASMERLGERLLTRAAFAVAAGRVADASELIDAVTALGVLAPEVEAARQALETIDIAAEPEPMLSATRAEAATAFNTEVEEAPTPIVEPGLDSVAETRTEQSLAVAEEEPVAVAEEEPLARAEDEQTEVEQTQVEQIEDEQAAGTLLALASEPVVAEEPEPQVATPGDEPEVQRLSLQELGISEYVAPRFPGYAERRGVSGTVEIGFTINVDGGTEDIQIVESQPGRIFDKSAIEAVQRWRFETRDAPLNAQVTLRFDYAP